MNSIKTYFAILIFILLNNFNKLYSQEKIKFENISVVDGLSNPSVQSIMQDSEGFMWFGTADGLNKYDGINFTIFRDEAGNTKSIKGSLILDIYEDSRNNIWIATEQGLNRYNRDSESFNLYQIDSSDTRQFYNGIVGIEEDSKGVLWTGKAYHGLTYFDRDSLKFKFVTIDTLEKSTSLFAIWDIVEDSNGELWYTKGQNFNSSSQLFKLNKSKTREIRFEDLVELNERQKTVSPRFFKDENENIWFSTFDGYTISYKPSNQKFKFYDLGENVSIFSTKKDKEGNLWCATIGEGLLKLNLSNENIQTYKPNITDEYSLSSLNNISIFIDRTGIFWLGTTGKGLDKFDPFREPFETYSISEGEGADKQEKIITAFCESEINANNVWVGTDKGLYVFSIKTNSISKAEKFYPIKIPDKLLVTSIIEDNRGILWLGSNEGIYKFDLNTDKTLHLKADPKNRRSLSNDIIRSIIEDKNDNIWIATQAGLNKYDYKNQNFKQYKFIDTSYTAELWDLMDQLYDSENRIASLTKIINDKDTSQIFEVEEPKDFLIVSIGEIFNIEGSERWDYGWLEDNEGNVIWTMDSLDEKHAGGAPKNRISAKILNLNAGSYKLRFKSDDSHSYQEWNASSPLYPEFWGISIFEINNKQKSYISSNLEKKEIRNSISDSNLRALFEDNEGNIWIGTNNSGFSIYDPEVNKFKHYGSGDNTVTTFTTNRVNDFIEGDDGIMWMATFGGLLKFDKKSETSQNYDIKNGMPSNYLMKLLKDENENIWFSSQKGLSQFDPSQSNDNSTISFVNYDIKDGLQAYQFSNGALKLSDGRLMFGGLKGFNIFYPGNINNNPPKVVITKFFISNREITAASIDSPLEKAISQTDELDLSYNQDDLSFEFTALHYARPDKNQYAHMLEGFDENWIYDNRAYATYTNLDPGEYVFRVRAANSDGVWNNEGKSIILNIGSPWWANTWAYISYVLIGGILLFTFDRAQKRKIIKKEREKQRILSAELRAKAAEAESRAVKAESERKTKELEEARNLQLSMLPKRLPKLPNLDIAVYMKTATEVGGDYYDFHVSLDGTLTAVIGDATGHGLNAGTIVTITKSLFNSHGGNSDILFTFEEISKVLKDMKFKYLSMCLQILKIRENKLQISSAGMPPALLYRNSTQKLEELLIKGMPLGAPASFPYEVRSTELNSGDTILLMSDGFPELMNKEKEMLGYTAAQNKFIDVAGKDPEEIITYLKEEGSSYVEHADPDDDVTFVVIKVK